MHVVVINNWKEETAEFAQEISTVLGITAFEVQQRIICGSPTVFASFADSQHALEMVKKLNPIGIETRIIDTAEVRSRTGSIIVRHFELKKSSLHIEIDDGRTAEIPYEKIDVLLPTTSTLTYSETTTTTERKFSLGKTMLMGMPMSKKVETQQEVTSEEYKKVLYLYVSKRQQPIIFNQEGLTYEGLGEAMQLSRGLNFAYLINELHRLSPGAAYDDRLLKRIGQVRLLSPTLNPETHIDIAVEILAQSLRQSSKTGHI
ncbi:hypothetical protein HQ585_04145 [candidate division KSB1 bacterium]|nr:hypothetical protein [candidate division KSB1 bacterium]